jgi:hypothetical protein
LHAGLGHPNAEAPPQRRARSSESTFPGSSAKLSGRGAGETAMERFIHRQNIEHYERLLQIATDESERKRILKLLEEEKKKTDLDGPSETKRRA